MKQLILKAIKSKTISNLFNCQIADSRRTAPMKVWVSAAFPESLGVKRINAKLNMGQ
jgi:hypothetical protein